MCGVLGCIGQWPDTDQWTAAFWAQRFRGPDSWGEWHGEFAGVRVAVGHQRLAIIDLTGNGAQPMAHPATGSILTFNGEIYNFLELREELESAGERFRGHSDTEVLLHALEHWGVEATLPRLNGMWAFAWVDLRGSRVVLSRDRFGEKPLHLTVGRDGVFFASDIRALLALHPISRKVDRHSLATFLRLGALDTDSQTMFKGITQVPAGSWMEFGARDIGRIPAARRFWRCPTEAAPMPMPELAERVRELFTDSVRLRLRSDVPIGLLLSGGLDSSSIAAAAHSIGCSNLAMLSLVSNDPTVDESAYIDAVAKHLGTKVHRVKLPEDPQAIVAHLEEVVACVGAPVNSLSNVAHWLLMREARQHGMTVILSGQGGDEILCGYRKYLGFHLQHLLRTGHPVSAIASAWGFLRNGAVLRQFDRGHAARYFRAPALHRPTTRLGPLLRDETVAFPGLQREETIQSRQRRDLEELSVPTLTHFEDRTSMAWSREIRLPFLDHRLVELLVPTDPAQKLHAGWTKYPLRAAFAQDLPDAIVWRRDKQGFANPEKSWMRTVLRARFEEQFLQRDAQVFARGILAFEGVSDAWRRFCATPSSGVWTRDFIQMMSLEIWLRHNARYLAD
jgi:asparagine synthase (glutamine-hydrolysing)